MTEHSPEAIAAYPDIYPEDDEQGRFTLNVQRTAFDRGRASLVEALCAQGLPESATIEQLIEHHRANAALAATSNALAERLTATREPLTGSSVDRVIFRDLGEPG